MVVLSGILALLAVAIYAGVLSQRFDVDAALFPLPIIGGGAVWLCLWGFLNALPLGGWLFYLGAAALLAAEIAKKQAGVLIERLKTPGFLVFFAASIAFLLLFAVTKPEFAQWDEFTLWGSAAKLTKLQNVLHPAAQGNLLAKAATPGMMLVVYLFQFFSSGFSEWSAYFAYNTLFAAGVAAMAAMPLKRWASTIVLAGCGFLLPYFFTAPTVGGLSTVYLSTLGDVPLGFVFGGTLCLYFALKDKKICWPILVVMVSFLTLIKDMGLAYSCIAIGLIALDWLVTHWHNKPMKQLVKTLGIGVALVIPVGVFYLGWSRYVAAVSGLNKAAVGSEDSAIDPVGMLVQGMAQLLGLSEPTEKFSQIKSLMLHSPVSVAVCLLGGGVMALAVIWIVLAGAFAAQPKGQERSRIVIFAVFGTLALMAFLVFHLFLYVYNFKDQEALQLKDYIRYIGPYYMGFLLAAMALLARAIQGGRWQSVARTASVGMLAALCGLFVWRGMPTAGFWNYPHVAYSIRDDVKERCEQVNQALDWQDTVLLISQGDDATRWNYFGYDLNATLARGFGGFGYGHEGDYNWDTTHMNIVSPQDAGEGKEEVYPYQTVATAEDLKFFLQDKQYTHILIDKSDDYIADVIGPAFGITDLPNQRTDRVILLRVVYQGDSVTWQYEQGGEQQ